MQPVMSRQPSNMKGLKRRFLKNSPQKGAITSPDTMPKEVYMVKVARPTCRSVEQGTIKADSVFERMPTAAAWMNMHPRTTTQP